MPIVLINKVNIEEYLVEEGLISYYKLDIIVLTLKRSKLAVVNLVPSRQSLMHRTVSINYCICVIRHVYIKLDSRDLINLHLGDYVI